jgi:hypothetical protein
VGREAPDGGRRLRSGEVDRRGPRRKPKAWPRGGGGERAEMWCWGGKFFFWGQQGIGLFRFSFLFIYFLNNSNLLNCSLFYPRHVSREPQFGKIFRTCSSSHLSDHVLHEQR